jgi:hypothetical protein
MDTRVAFLKHRLELSADQTAQIEGLLEAQREQAEAWFDEHPDATREERREFMSSIREETAAAIESKLNDDQSDTFRRTMDRVYDREAMRRARQEVFINDLGLSAEQREELYRIRTSHHTVMRTWREQNPEATREEWRAFRDGLRRSGRAAMEQFLTPEQLEKMDEHRADRGDGSRSSRERPDSPRDGR